jgi:hypothetical protein
LPITHLPLLVRIDFLPFLTGNGEWRMGNGECLIRQRYLKPRHSKGFASKGFASKGSASKGSPFNRPFGLAPHL